MENMKRMKPNMYEGRRKKKRSVGRENSKPRGENLIFVLSLSFYPSFVVFRDKFYFIDRNGDAFEAVLEFYRTNKVIHQSKKVRRRNGKKRKKKKKK